MVSENPLSGQFQLIDNHRNQLSGQLQLIDNRRNQLPGQFQLIDNRRKQLPGQFQLIDSLRNQFIADRIAYWNSNCPGCDNMRKNKTTDLSVSRATPQLSFMC